MKQEEIADVIAITTKNVLTAKEAASYAGLSMSGLYKLTHAGKIPFYRPGGKLIYFNRAELEAWLQRNRVATTEEIHDRAARYTMKGGAK